MPPSESASSSPEVTVFAQTDFRNQPKRFGIKQADRRAHMYILGKTGTGKSTLLESLMLADAKSQRGFALLDPHGDLAKRIKARIPESRAHDVIDFDTANPDQSYGFNPLAYVPAAKRSLVCSGLVQVFKHLWSDSWGPRLEYILRNSILSLLEYPGATLSDINMLLTDKRFREKVQFVISLSTLASILKPRYRSNIKEDKIDKGYPARRSCDPSQNNRIRNARCKARPYMAGGSHVCKTKKL